MRYQELIEKDLFGVQSPTIKQVAQKHGVPVEKLQHQLMMGIQVEKEHTGDEAIAAEIALDHLGEMPDYYTKLLKMEHGK
jgi:hypothetical protein